MSCKRQPQRRLAVGIVALAGSDLAAVTCTRQNTDVIMRVCDEWGVAGSSRCDPAGCRPVAPAPEEKLPPGIFCIKSATQAIVVTLSSNQAAVRRET